MLNVVEYENMMDKKRAKMLLFPWKYGSQRRKALLTWQW